MSRHTVVEPDAHTVYLDKWKAIDKINSDLAFLHHQFQAACMLFQDAVTPILWAIDYPADEKPLPTNRDLHSPTITASECYLAILSIIFHRLHEAAGEFHNGQTKVLLGRTHKTFRATWTTGFNARWETGGLAVALEWAEREDIRMAERIDGHYQIQVEKCARLQRDIDVLDEFAEYLRALDKDGFLYRRCGSFATAESDKLNAITKDQFMQIASSWPSKNDPKTIYELAADGEF
jgi:hypothetical protein